MLRIGFVSVLAAAILALSPCPVSAQSVEQAITEAAAAFKAGRADELVRLDAEIARLRDRLPDWVEARQQAASRIDPAKQRAAAVWNRLRQQAIAAAGAGDRGRAVDLSRQALALARDSLGDGHFATILSQSDLATLDQAEGRSDEAEAGYRRAAAMATAALGAGHPETLKIWRSLADLLRDRLQLPAAAAVLVDASRAAAAALGPEHPRTLALTLALARVRLDGGDAEAAAALLEGACAAMARVYGEAHGEFAACLARHGDALRQTGAFAAAAALFERAMAIQAVVLPAADPQALTTRVQAARVLHRQGRLAEARTLLDGVIAATAAESSLHLAAKGDLADLLTDLGEYAPAEALAREVLERQTARLGPDHPETVAALSSLASLLRMQGHLVEAERTFTEVWTRYRRILGDDHRTTVTAANNLGEILEKQGSFDRAEPLLRAALDGSRKAFGESHPATLAAMNNLALLYESQGLFDKAEPLYRGVIAVFSRTIGPRHPDTIASTNNLAYLLMLKGDYPQATVLFREVHAAWSKDYGRRHQNTLKALNNLARALAAQGKTREAETAFDTALAARRAGLGETHPDTLRSMHDLAALYRATQRLPAAETLLRRTLAGDEAVLGPSHPYTFETLNTLAAVQEARGDLAGAFATRRLIFERRTGFLDRVLPVTGDNAREGYVRLAAPELSAYVARAVDLDDTAQAGRSLLEVGLARKGILLKVASELSQVGRLSRDPDLARLTADLVDLRKRLAALTLSGPTAETRDTHVETVNALENRIDEIQGELGRASQRFRRTVAPFGVEDLVRVLPDDAVLVDYILYGEEGQRRLAAAVLRKEAGQPVFSLVRFGDPAALERAGQAYRAAIQDEEIEIDDLLDSGQEVHRLVWKPLEPALAGRTRVYVVPDGLLNILPFSALVEDNRKYLIERINLFVLTSSRDLAPATTAAPVGGFVINAGPDYNTDAVTGRDVLDKVRSRSAGGGDLQLAVRGMSGLRGLHFDPLPGAEREGQLIQRTVEGQGRPAVIHSRADAQEKALREMENPPEVLHIATHGFFLKPDDTLRKRLLKLQRSGEFQMPPPGDNPLLRAGLAFAGINSNAQVLGEIDTDNDGVLTALEVLGLDLAGTRLAILSACETGLGEVHEGEGVYGLRRAFQEAGVRSVVSSLWEVSDAGTQTLMAALYKRLLAGKTPHDALREAQLEMLRTPQWSTPYVWSAFFMVGG